MFFFLKYIHTCVNEWLRHLYSALLYIAVHPKHFTIMCGGGLSSTTTSVYIYIIYVCIHLLCKQKLILDAINHN